GTAFQPALFGGKRNTVPGGGLSAEDVLRNSRGMSASGGRSGVRGQDRRQAPTPATGLRPGSQRVERRREEKRQQQNVRHNITPPADHRDRQQGASETPPAAMGFKVGEKVRHHKFGEGQVLAVKPSGVDEEVTVMFKTGGTRRLLASMARLERI